MNPDKWWDSLTESEREALEPLLVAIFGPRHGST